ncbi:MAG: hypothetical protein AAF483_08505 [Planctomycetota bacterium]
MSKTLWATCLVTCISISPVSSLSAQDAPDGLDLVRLNPPEHIAPKQREAFARQLDWQLRVKAKQLSSVESLAESWLQELNLLDDLESGLAKKLAKAGINRASAGKLKDELQAVETQLFALELENAKGEEKQKNLNSFQKLRLKSKELDLQKGQASLDLMKDEFTRLKKLYEKQTTSREELQRAQFDLQVAQLEVEKMTLELEAAKVESESATNQGIADAKRAELTLDKRADEIKQHINEYDAIVELFKPTMIEFERSLLLKQVEKARLKEADLRLEIIELSAIQSLLNEKIPASKDTHEEEGAAVDELDLELGPEGDEDAADDELDLESGTP